MLSRVLLAGARPDAAAVRPLLRVFGAAAVALAALSLSACGSEDQSVAPPGYYGDDPDGSTTPSKDAGKDAVADAADGSDGSTTECIKKTCSQLDAECGSAPDGCGGKVTCGSCQSGLTCGGGGTNKCGTNACAPKTCSQLDASCGYVSDGCAEALDCGSCPAPFTCGGAGQPNECGCTKKTCAQLGASCGSLPDGCDGKVECGTCASGQSCGGGGAANTCGSGTCVAKTCSQLSASCGFVSDGCSKALDCGTCTGDDVCGGGSKPNQCGCTAKTCMQLSASCGMVDNGCGTEINCGSCPDGETCGGGGVTHQCGCACSTPHATPACSGGVCSIGVCDPGWVDCDGEVTNGCEIDTQGDPANCGACGNPCSFANAAGACSAGQCVMGDCSPGFSDCDSNPATGCEIQTESDTAHCGSCVNDCSASIPSGVTNVACTAGSCAIAGCNAGTFDQNGVYTDGCECSGDAHPGTCGAGTSLGSLALGATASAGGNLTPVGDEDWFVASFESPTSCSFRPRLTLTDGSGTDSIRIDVFSDCSGAALACTGGGSSTGRTAWDFNYSDACGANAAIDPGKSASGPTTVYVRVYATGTSTSCLPYQLDFAN